MRKTITFLCLIITTSSSFCQKPDYQKLFAEDWKNAQQLLTVYETSFKQKLQAYQVDYFEAMAIVFPELVRYNALRDKMETALLKTLYINYGKTYANFSVGHFQMKPSFAERIATYINTPALRSCKNLVLDSSAFDVDWEFRKAIVHDLENITTQINYLIVFIKICEANFGLKNLDAENRIRFLSAAYNTGFDKAEKTIWKMAGKKFYTTKLFSNKKYAYSDISVYWYLQKTKSKT